MQNLLYVSALLDLNEDRSAYRPLEKSFDLFKPILNSSIKMICFVSKNIKDFFTSTSASNNIEFIQIELEDLDTYKLVKSFQTSLPLERNEVKDTLNFLILMNSKTEFVKRAMTMANYSNYAWLDFNICHVFKDIEGSIKYLEKIQLSSKLDEKILKFPGCWPKGYKMDQSIYNSINWRFCGGFFIGDRKSLENFITVFDKAFFEILSSGKIMWETNVWAYLEFFTPFLDIEWFKGDHDDSIIRFKEF